MVLSPDGCVARRSKMLTYGEYAPLFDLLAPCPRTKILIFQGFQHMKNMNSSSFSMHFIIFGLALLTHCLFFINAATAGTVKETDIPALAKKLASGLVHVNSSPQSYEYITAPLSTKGMGSGFIIDTLGHVITNAHVLSNVRSIEVILSDGATWPARLVGTDPETDLAVLEILAPSGVLEKIAPLSFSPPEPIEPGSTVFALSNPRGLGYAVSIGHIHARPRSIATPGGQVVDGVIENDLAMEPGDSGGPLFDTYGRVIGITTRLFSPGPERDVRSFAISSDAARDVSTQIISTGRVQRPWFGASFLTITPRLSSILNLPVQEGAMITKVHPEGPAMRAGLAGATRDLTLGNRTIAVGGDVIVGIDDQPIGSDLDVIAILRTKSPGDTVTVTYFRDGSLKKAAIKLGEKTKTP